MESVCRARAEGVPRWTDSTIKGRDEIMEDLHELASSSGEVPGLVVLDGPRGAGTQVRHE